MKPDAKFEAVEDTPINRVFFALNYYISTGDHIGEGVSARRGRSMLFAVPYRPREWEDADNWKRLKARIDELQAAGFPCDARDAGSHGHPEFEFGEIAVLETELDRFAEAIKAKPGPLGWGSMRTFLQRMGFIQPDP